MHKKQIQDTNTVFKMLILHYVDCITFNMLATRGLKSMSLTVTLVCEHVHLCQCPKGVGKKHFYPGADCPSDLS